MREFLFSIFMLLLMPVVLLISVVSSVFDKVTSALVSITAKRLTIEPERSLNATGESAPSELQSFISKVTDNCRLLAYEVGWQAS